ncbi:MAG: hypothetical protein JWP66_1869 [Naasia sp.]|nr:hypothetical protein [Naasia sp.]
MITRTRRWRASGAAVLCAALVSCAASPSGPAAERPTATPTASTSAAPYDENEQSWFAGPPDPAEFEEVAPQEGGDLRDDEPFPGDLSEGEGTEATAQVPPTERVFSAEEIESADDLVDPCLTVSISEWVQWVGSGGVAVYVVEPWVNCLYVDTDADLVRMTANLIRPEDGGELETDVAAGTPLEEFGDGVYLLEHYPLPFATTAVARMSGGGFVAVSIYNRDPSRDAPAIASAAAGWAARAAGIN